MGKRCKFKVRYNNYEEALNNANRYMSEILTLTYMVPFYCNKHNCYHVGHNQVKRNYVPNLLEEETHTTFLIRQASNDRNF